MYPETLNNQIGCYTEYSRLKRVVLSPPNYMKIREIINVTQAHYADENINTSVAEKQHQALVDTLKKENIEVVLLPACKDLPEQVFTRDLAFVLGNQVIVGQMEEPIRKEEIEVFKSWLQKEGIPYQAITDGPIEGGDVIINGKQVWVGDSYRTSKEAVAQLREVLPAKKVISVPFDGDYLHLDCVFNILSPTEGLIYPPAFPGKEVKMLKDQFDLIEVSDEEQFTLGTNVFSLGMKKVLSLPINEKVNCELRKRGYQVVEIDITEIIKSGGSFRCVTLPLLREQE